MSNQVALRRTADGFEFVSEAALETFAWNHLPELLRLTPLKRQYLCNGEICDILAVDEQRSLVILELKNGEDRYVIQQLTRYYANLLEEKPFAKEIDYDRPIRLMAIAPTFHRHNLTDQQYSRLDIDLLQFQVHRDGTEAAFQLKNLTGKTLCTIPLAWNEANVIIPEGIAEPPELLLKWIGGCTVAEREGFLKLRSDLLTCSDQMKELVERGAIYYGATKSRLCAEIRYERTHQRPVLFLWLPTPSSQDRSYHSSPNNPRKVTIGRLRCWTNGQTISHVGYILEGLGKMKTEAEWEQVPKAKRPNGLRWSLTANSHIPTDLRRYLHTYQEEVQPNYWQTLTQMAIAIWLERQQ